ncbi:MAG TPA: hypothetical protein VFU51_04925 [Gaiellaceae bacterium]|nr:hypothetical protein [Gaiellaceae bacterium]
MSTLWRLLGALAGGVAGVALGIGVAKAFESSVLWVALAAAGLIVVCVVLYLVARTQRTAGSTWGEFMPGLLLGFNTGINGALIASIVGPVGIVVCVVPALAVIAPLARTGVYQFFLGWFNLVMPMSWVVIALGLLFVLASGLLALVNLIFKSEFLKIEKLTMDPGTGTTYLVGGLAGNGNLSPNSTGFNMGSFAFLKSGQDSAYLEQHEAGHTLNLGVWGFVVHFVGALDENVFGGGNGAYTELFAESHVPQSSRQGPIFPMWCDPVGESATAFAAHPVGT